MREVDTAEVLIDYVSLKPSIFVCVFAGLLTLLVELVTL